METPEALLNEAPAARNKVPLLMTTGPVNGFAAVERVRPGLEVLLTSKVPAPEITPVIGLRLAAGKGEGGAVADDDVAGISMPLVEQAAATQDDRAVANGDGAGEEVGAGQRHGAGAGLDESSGILGAAGVEHDTRDNQDRGRRSRWIATMKGIW